MRPLPLIAAVLLLAAPAAAQSLPDIGRFAMSPVEGGFLRLDTRSGAVSFCRIENGAATCRSGPDDRAALDAEIARLAQENRELRGRLAAAPPAKALPTDEEFDRVLGFAERFMRRMMRATEPPAPGDKT